MRNTVFLGSLPDECTLLCDLVCFWSDEQEGQNVYYLVVVLTPQATDGHRDLNWNNFA